MATPTQRMPAKSPKWATDFGSTLEPSEAEKAAGWQQGQRPPARWQNYFQRTSFQLLDILFEALLKDWRVSPPIIGSLSTPGDSLRGLGWHGGDYWVEQTGRLYRSINGRDSWFFIDELPQGTTEAATTIESSGSRVIVCTLGDGAFYSDNDGGTWTSIPTLGTGWCVALYMPNADLWIGFNDFTLEAMASTDDGATWSNIGGAVWVNREKNAENGDGSIVLCSERFSVNQGSSWANQVNGADLDGYIYSELIGNFLQWEGTGSGFELRTMSGTAGTWNTGVYATVAVHPLNHVVNSMWEMRGALFASISVGSPSPDFRFEIIMSRDLGLTWEIVCSSVHRLPVAPKVGGSGSPSSEYIVLGGGSEDSTMAPLFAGTDFAALLAP